MNNLRLSLSYAAVVCAGALLIVDVVDAESSKPSDTSDTVTEPSEDMIDLALTLTFPTSDPPAWMAALPGRRRHQENRTVIDEPHALRATLTG
jgi:hypothetical protein